MKPHRSFLKKFIYIFISFCFISIFLSKELYAANNVFSTKAIKAIETLINSDGENNFFTDDSSVANITGPVVINGTVQYTPSSDIPLLAATQITVTKKVMRIVGDGGAVILIGTPTIIAPTTDGYELIIQGTHDTNTVTLQDESNLPGSNLQLYGGTDVVLGKGDIIHLIFDLGDSNWYEISRSNN